MQDLIRQLRKRPEAFPETQARELEREADLPSLVDRWRSFSENI